MPRHGIERVIPLRDDLGEHRIERSRRFDLGRHPERRFRQRPAGPGDDPHRRCRPDDHRRAHLRARVRPRRDDGRGRRWPLPARDRRDLRLAADDRSRPLHRGGTRAAPTPSRCEQGSLGSRRRCGDAQRTSDGATFTATSLPPQTALTIRMTWPDSVVAVSAGDSALDAADIGYALLAGLGDRVLRLALPPAVASSARGGADPALGDLRIRHRGSPDGGVRPHRRAGHRVRSADGPPTGRSRDARRGAQHRTPDRHRRGPRGARRDEDHRSRRVVDARASEPGHADDRRRAGGDERTLR